MSQKMELFIVTTMRTSNPILCSSLIMKSFSHFSTPFPRYLCFKKLFIYYHHEMIIQFRSCLKSPSISHFFILFEAGTFVFYKKAICTHAILQFYKSVHATLCTDRGLFSEYGYKLLYICTFSLYVLL
jgi:hypothetical protein